MDHLYSVNILTIAAARGLKEEVATLMKNQDVNSLDDNGWNALMLTCSQGHASCASLLIEGGADVNHTNNHRRTALMYACLNGHQDVVEVLLKEKCNYELSDKYGRNALMYAAIGGDVDCVSFLLKEGCAVELKDNDGWTAPMHAAMNSSVDVLCKFSQMGILESTVEKRGDDDGRNALSLAVIFGQDAAVYTLLSCGMSAVHMDADGWSALMHAVDEGDESIINYLLDLDEFAPHKLQKTWTDRYGTTVLMIAAFEGNPNVVKRLKEHVNADKNEFLKRDVQGYCAGDYARKKEIKAMLQAYVPPSPVPKKKHASFRRMRSMGGGKMKTVIDQAKEGEQSSPRSSPHPKKMKRTKTLAQFPSHITKQTSRLKRSKTSVLSGDEEGKKDKTTVKDSPSDSGSITPEMPSPLKFSLSVTGPDMEPDEKRDGVFHSDSTEKKKPKDRSHSDTDFVPESQKIAQGVFRTDSAD